ncbi:MULTISPECIES: AAA family ATPase [Microbacterium]|uniref:AAA family ATPase n=1 Tax=Microbacterium TaxID=33882 RepID=UPI0005665799|nr:MULTISPECIES: AAA family ATPase [Microbacterium]
MIQTVAVAGYRSLVDLVLPLGRLTVVTGANGTGKSSLYRALRLLAAGASGDAIGAIAEEGGLDSALWAGPETPGGAGAQGTVRRGPISLRLGVATDDLGYLVDYGLPQTDKLSVFARDAEIKREQIFAGAVARPATTLVDRTRAAVRVRRDGWVDAEQRLAPFESILTDLGDGDAAPETLSVRRMLRAWRFYDHFRTDRDSPARHPRVGTRTQTLAHGGENLAAVWATIQDAGYGDALAREVARAFPGGHVEVAASGGLFRLLMHQPGLLRPLETTELSDGTLRYLLLCAALLPARPAPLLVLNEPESSLHPDLLDPLGALINAASDESQIIVVTHADRLATALANSGADIVRLESTGYGTRIEGQGMLDVPAWHWPSR